VHPAKVARPRRCLAENVVRSWGNLRPTIAHASKGTASVLGNPPYSGQVRSTRRRKARASLLAFAPGDGLQPSSHRTTT